MVVAVSCAIGKGTRTDWDGHNLWYEAEIYDKSISEKIRRGIVQHVSVGADYEAVDVVDGQLTLPRSCLEHFRLVQLMQEQ